MLIDKIALLNFRNYQTLTLSFHDKLNLFVGDNAQGKTNILEAIYYSGTGRSHRTNKDADLIKWNENYFILKISGENLHGRFVLEIGLNREGKKKIKLNSVQKKRTGDILGTVKVILFSPEDLTLVKGSPVVRRKFIDTEISQISPGYYYNLLKYQRILVQRNALLKDIKMNKNLADNLPVWDRQLALFGAKLIYKKLDVLKKLTPLTRLMHRKITNGKEELETRYISNVVDKDNLSLEEIEKLFLEKIAANRDEELDRGITIIGPHRDDLVFYINGKEVKHYGSQGQQRSCSLSIKLAELELVKGETGEYPLLLLDDVMSELDEDRRQYLLESVQSKIQTFITTTDASLLAENLKKNASLFTIREGIIQF